MILHILIYYLQFILAVAHIYVLLTSENIGKYSFLNLKKK